jgi:NitT/TauT family transport system substrate-binding protein
MNRRTFLKTAAGVTVLTASNAALGACAPATPTTRREVSLPMGFIPNVQYAAHYMALDKGHWSAAGLDVKPDYKFETDGIKLVGANQLQFAMVSGEQIILARAQGLPVVYVAQWYRRYPIALFSLAEKGFTSLEQLKGKKIGLPRLDGASYVGWRALLNANGLNEGDFSVEAIGFTQAAAVQQGQVDAAIGYNVNEPIVLAQKGIPVNVIDIGKVVDMVPNGLMTNEETIKNNPDLVRGMVSGLVRGISDVIADPTAAMQVCTKFVEKLDVNDTVQRAVLDATVDNMRGARIGESSLQAWNNTQDVLALMGTIKSKQDASTFFSNAFLPS